MEKSKLKLVCKNDNTVSVRRKYNILDKDTLIAIDRAASIDFSNIENNKNFVKIDIDKYLEAMDDEDKDLFDFTNKIYDVRKAIYNRIKDDILTFKPYAMLFDMASKNLDNEFIEDVSCLLNDTSLSNKNVIEEILCILEDYIC